MENAETILVIILASFLAIFLLLAIVATLKIIQLIKHLNHVAAVAEDIVVKAETAASVIGKTAGPTVIGNMLANIYDAVKGKSRRR